MHLSEKFASVYAGPTQSATDYATAFTPVWGTYDTMRPH